VLPVTNTSDTGVSGDSSLRGEILAAQDGDSIDFAHGLNGDTITLSSGNEILIDHNISIDGQGVVAVSGSGSRVFEIAAGFRVTINGLTIENGNGTGNSIAAEGGAILNHGMLTLANDIIQDNNVAGASNSSGGTGRGGGIFNDAGGILSLNGDAIQGNVAHGGDALRSTSAQKAGAGGAGLGGGLYDAAQGDVSVDGGEFSKNTAQGGNGNGTHQGGAGGGDGGSGQGGGIYVDGGTLTFSDEVLVSGNAARGGSGGTGAFSGSGGEAGIGAGGGLFNNVGTITADGAGTVLTFSGNSARGGQGGVAPNDGKSGGAGGVGQGGGLFSSAGSLSMGAGAFKGNITQGGEGGSVSQGPIKTGTPGVSGEGQGGAAYLAASNSATLAQVSVASNSAHGGTATDGQGGGLYVDGGTVLLSESTVAANVAAGGAGAGGSIVFHFVGRGSNGGNGAGGGLYVSPSTGIVSMTADTFLQNSADGGPGGFPGGTGGNGTGGAVAAAGTVNLTNDTLAANSANGGQGGNAVTGGDLGPGPGTGGNAQGGAICANAGDITLLNDTIAGSSPSITSKPTAGNSANFGTGGLPRFQGSKPGADGTAVGGGLFDAGNFITLHNTIVANNTAGNSAPDVSGAFTAGDHNLIGNAKGSTGFGGSDLEDVDPDLGMLSNNGGPTQTMLPLGGPAIDHGDDSVAPSTDQRGITRPQGTHADIGAVEVVNLTFTILSGNSQTARRGKQFKPLVVELTENGKPVAGVTVDFTVVPAHNRAGGKLKHAHVTTDAQGQAAATVTANSTAGTFTVRVKAGGLPTLTFKLRNR